MTAVARFDGIDDRALAPDSPTLRKPTTAITMAGWLVRRGAGETWGQIVSKEISDAGGNQVSPYWSYSLFKQSTSAPDLGTWLAGSSFAWNNDPLPTVDVWRFVAYTWTSGSGIRLRVWEANNDTALFDTSTAAHSGTISYTDPGPLGLGGNEPGTECHQIDMARWGIHDAVLTDAQLKTWRDTGTPPITLACFFYRLQDDWNDSHQTNHLTPNGATLVDVGAVPWTDTGGGTARAELAPAWSVRSTARAEAAPAWSVRSTASSTAAPAWSVRSVARSEAAPAWTVRSTARSEAAPAWSVRSTARGELAPAWSVRSTVASQLAPAWSVRDLARAEAVPTWSVESATQTARAELAPAWSVRALARAELAPAWTVRGHARTTLAPAWSVRTVAGADLAPTWTVRRLARSEAAPAWSVESNLALIVPAARTFTVRADPRVLVVRADPRVLTVPRENRVTVVTVRDTAG